MYIYTYMYVYTHTYMCIHVCINVSVYIYIYTHTYMYLHIVLCKPYANHRTKTYSGITKDKECGIKAYYYVKSSIHKGR